MRRLEIGRLLAVGLICGAGFAAAFSASGANNAYALPGPGPEAAGRNGNAPSAQSAEIAPDVRRLLDELEAAPDDQHADVVRAFQQIAFAYQQRSQFDVAEVILRRGLAFVQRTRGSLYINNAIFFHELAKLRLTQARYDECADLLRRAIEIATGSVGTQDPEVMSGNFSYMLFTRGRLSAALGKFGEAEPDFRWMIRIQENVFGRNHEILIETLRLVAEQYLSQNRIGIAEPLLHRALSVAQSNPDVEAWRVADVLEILGDTYLALGMLSRAEPVLSRALAIQEEALGPSSLGVTGLLHSLGNVYTRLERYDEAEAAYRRQLVIVESELGPNNAALAVPLHNLSELYLEQKRYAEAEEVLQRALALRIAANGPKHPSTASLLGSLGSLYLKDGRIAEGVSAYEQAAGIFEAAYAPEHPRVVEALRMLSRAYIAAEKWEDADAVLRRMLKIQEGAHGIESHEVAWATYYLAELYRFWHRLDEAEVLYLKQMAIERRLPGFEDAALVNGLMGLEAIRTEQGRHGEAQALQAQIDEITNRLVIGPDRPPPDAYRIEPTPAAPSENDAASSQTF